MNSRMTLPHTAALTLLGFLTFSAGTISVFSADTQGTKPTTVTIAGRLARADRVIAKAKVSGKEATDQELSLKAAGLSTANLPGIDKVQTFSSVPGVVVITTQQGSTPTKKFGQTTAEAAAKTAEIDLAGKIKQLRESGEFEYVEPDYIVRMTATPNDSAYADGTLWGLRNTGQSGGTPGADINVANAWDHSIGSGVVVAVVDSGVRYTHRDLANSMWTNTAEIPNNRVDDDRNGYVDDVRGINSINGTGDPMDDNDHGTHVAGTIAAQANGGGPIVGVAHGSKIMALKFLASDGSGSTSDAIECIDYAIAKRANVINASWGGPNYSQGLYDAIQRANAAGIVFLAAAGNDYGVNNDLSPSYPANYDLANVISVAAINRFNQLADFSNLGPSTVDIAAPGEEIYSSISAGDTDYSFFSGTSMATPHVAGVAALIKSRYPSISKNEWFNRLLSTSKPVTALTGKVVTGGVVDAFQALTAVPDGVLELSAAASVTPVVAGRTFTFSVRVTDLEPVMNATVIGSFSGSGVTFIDNGLFPDLVKDDGTYTARLTVPTGSPAVLKVTASAPSKAPVTKEFTFTTVQPPVNDNFRNRTPIPEDATVVTGSNAYASSETGEPPARPTAGGHSVWWRWTAPETGLATVTTFGSGFDTILAVYRGSAVDHLTWLGSNDDQDGLQSSVTFFAMAGTTYAIQVDGYHDATGSITLNAPIVGAPQPGAPVITEHPAPTRVAMGSSFTLSVVATGNGVLTYQWYHDDQAVPRATGASYTVANATMAHLGFYHVVVANSIGQATSNSVLVSLDDTAVAPENDNFANAFELTGASGSTTGSNILATGQAGEPNHAGVSLPLSSLWWKWTAPAGGFVTIDTSGSTYDTTLAVYRGDSLDSLTVAGANDDVGGIGTTSAVVISAVEGTTYHIAVDGWAFSTGAIVLNYSFTASAATVASNDNFNRASVFTSGTGISSNIDATEETGEPNHGSASRPMNSIWWTWTATSTGPVVFDTFSSDFDTTLAVYTGSAINNLTLMAENDDYGGSVQSRVNFLAIAGQTYKIAVDGQSNAEGRVVLKQSFPSPNLFTTSSYLGNNWYWFSSLGYVNAASFNFVDDEGWIYHNQLGWLYATHSSNAIYWWDMVNGWQYTSLTSFPYLYTFNTNSWWFFDRTSGLPRQRWFFDFGRNQWISN